MAVNDELEEGVMASSPESYAVEREFAESMDDPFEAILELRARVAELEFLGKSDAATLVEVRAWMDVEPGKPVIRAVMDASRALARAPSVRGTLPRHASRSRNPE